MAISKSEAFMYGLITGKVLPKGTTRKALRLALSAIPTVSQPVARGALGVSRAALGAGATLARRNPIAATGLGALALQQAGAFDPIEEAIRSEVDRRTQSIMDIPSNLEQAMESPAFQPAVKRKVSKYSKAVKAGMAAVKRSKFLGAKGKISNPKQAFARVNKVASAAKRGKKVATKGVTGVIKRAVGRFL